MSKIIVSDLANAVPPVGALEQNDLGINNTDEKLFVGDKEYRLFKPRKYWKYSTSERGSSLYKNNTNQEIVVQVSGLATGNLIAALSVDGDVVSRSGSAGGSLPVYYTLSATVPPGSDYQMSHSPNSQSHWAELRESKVI